MSIWRRRGRQDLTRALVWCVMPYRQFRGGEHVFQRLDLGKLPAFQALVDTRAVRADEHTERGGHPFDWGREITSVRPLQ